MAVLNKISDTVAMASKGNAEAFSASSSATAYNTQYLWDFLSVSESEKKKHLALSNSLCPVLGIGRWAAQSPWLRAAH